MAAKTEVKSEAKGHAAHTKSAENQQGLPGKMPRPIKVVMLGAGSNFTHRLMCDILQIPGNERGEIALVDIDPQRLKIMYQLIQRLVAELGMKGWTVKAATDRKTVLRGADYLVNCIEVSGVGCVRFDNDIPAKYGVDQCIGDTIGPGGLFKGLRTIPVFLEILKDAERYCPRAIVLNYTNPMSMLCLASGRASSMQVVGLCHSVQGTGRLLARRAGVPYGEMTWECAGINHLAWFTRLEHLGKDLYPILKRKARKDLEAGRPLQDKDPADLVRKDMMLHFGAFITESSGHLSEYLPYYRKRKDLLKKFMRENYQGQSSFYADEWPKWRKWADKSRLKLLRGEEPVRRDRSYEYASWIIEAREKNQPFSIHGNVLNRARGGGPLIPNLSHDGCVEVACMIDRNGVNPTVFGPLPSQMAAICESNMRMFDLAATAAIERSVEAAILALTLDPLTAACCSPAECKAMALELFKAERKFLRGFK